MTPIIAFERLFFAVFGQTSPDDINSQRNTRPEWTENLFKIVFGIYMLVSVVVLINLLIAMMSDTYQRIQVSRAHGAKCCPFLFLSFPTIYVSILNWSIAEYQKKTLQTKKNQTKLIVVVVVRIMTNTRLRRHPTTNRPPLPSPPAAAVISAHESDSVL